MISFESFLVSASAHPSGFMGQLTSIAEKLRVSVTASSSSYLIFRIGSHRGQRFFGGYGTWFALPKIPQMPRLELNLPRSLQDAAAPFCARDALPPHELFAMLCIVGYLAVEFAPRKTWPNALCSVSSMRAGRVWTLFFSNLVHANFVHLVNNLVQILNLGPFLFPTLGCERSLGLFVCAMLASSVASLLWHGYYKGRRGAGSIGASGVAMALVAANAALFPDVVVHVYGVELTAAQVPVAYLLLDVMLSRPGMEIDVSSHVGGALAGYVLARRWRPWYLL